MTEPKQQDFEEGFWGRMAARASLRANKAEARVKELEARFSKMHPTGGMYAHEFLGHLVPAGCFHEDEGIVPAWRAYELSEELVKLRGQVREREEFFERELLPIILELDPDCPDAHAYLDGHCSLAELVLRKVRPNTKKEDEK